ncbi:phage tail protein [Desulfopila sp. IMCC35006]|uniref:phage baseplate assembly protein V n=1 Tax=Desulfopila sp. IMCC35006 TaxID=2569542 RepID=UPI0010AC3E83|nr:phage baseplate assembly protein V [Desulfopila sp. IMCC35006]TKB25860.1 phage tail protein [Desulfopila sp. IMCC35006]
MEETVIRLARFIDEKRFGKYRAVVVDNQDPQKRGRLKLRIPSVLAEQNSDWALPCLPYGGLDQQGLFFIPDIDAQVWVEFEEGDISRPIWVGTFWQQQSDTPEDAVKEEPTTRMIQTSSGHILQFDDEEGEERFRLYHPADAEMIIDKQGTITLNDASGAVLRMDAASSEVVVEDANGNVMTMNSSGTKVEDANGNVIEMAAAGITAEAPKIVLQSGQVHLGGEGGEPVIKGQSFLSLFATHIHTVAPTVGGPTSPPIPQGEMSSLSTTVKTI